MMSHKRIRKALYWTFVQKDLLKRASAIHAITSTEADRVNSLGINVPTRIIPNGVSPPREGGKLPTSFPSGSVVLFVGRIHAVKGLDVLLDAFSRTESDSTLVVVGPDTDGLWEKLRHRTPQAKIVFLGAVEDLDLDAIYRRADILVLPSRSEVLGLVTLEAMAHKVPVIVSPFCGFSKADLAGAGEIVNLDPTILAKAIDALLSDPERRKRMGSAGFQLVSNRYSWEVIGRSLADLYGGIGQAS